MHRIREFVRNAPGLSFLLVILGVIDVTSIKPQYDLVGWDNYSSYFNLFTNIFRTFFATWREYRGLGVPSDSESTDLFRQLFYLILKPVAPETMLDQLYMVVAMNIGVIAMYFFAKAMYEKFIRREGEQVADTVGAVAGFFYLFNLNTLSVFYFPMIMYINRFFAIPLTFLMFLRLGTHEKVSKREYLFWCVAMLFCSGSYMTATVFITMVMSLGIFTFFLQHKKRLALVFVFFLFANLFWLLPFANYTVQKSSIIRLAPNFIDANETQLNKPKNFYDLRKHLILFPNFFDTQFNDINLTKKEFFHPTATIHNKLPYNIALALFPLLYLLGSFLIVCKKFTHRLLWIPVMIFTYLFLSMKEFSALGFIYSFLDSVTPLFGVLFRFGDTKFHPFIAFSGAIAAAVTVVYLMRVYRDYSVKLMSIKFWMVIVTVLTLMTFNDYFKGRFIGFYMYNQIPDAYHQIAKQINEDPEEGRVLHLPMDRHGYWKSYVWGMVGSSFFHFMIDKPFIDRSFEPASLENAQLHERIMDLIDNTQSLSQSEGSLPSVEQFADLLSRTGVKYIILDETVNAQLFPRGITLWGKFNLADSRVMLEKLEQAGYVEKTSAYDISLDEYLKTSQKEFSLDDEQLAELSGKTYPITVYIVKDRKPKLRFESAAQLIDPQYKELLTSTVLQPGETVVQDDRSEKYVLYPFHSLRAQTTVDNGMLTLTFPKPFKKDGRYTLDVQSVPNSRQRVPIEVYLRAEKDNLIFSLLRNDLPDLQGVHYAKKFSEVTVPVTSLKGTPQLTDLRVRIHDTVIPVQATTVGVSDVYVGSVMAPDGPISVGVMQKIASKQIPGDQFSLTENPNCFFDKLEDYSYSITKNKDAISVESKNGSTCFWRDMYDVLQDKAVTHAELRFKVDGASTDHDAEYDLSKDATSKPVLQQYVTSLPKPNYLRVCVKENNVDDCYNNKQIISVDGPVGLHIPLEKSVLNVKNLLIFMSLKNIGYQDQQMTISNMTVDTFSQVASQDMVVEPVLGVSAAINMKQDQDLTVSYVLPISLYAHYFTGSKDGYYLSNQSCQSPSYRTFRYAGDRLLSYVVGCDNTASVLSRFSSANFYLWSVNYNLASGKFPKFLVNDGFNSYKDEIVSLYQGYPEIPGFKAFQRPEWWSTLQGVEKTLSSLPSQNAYTYLRPQPALRDEKPKNFTFHQDSENEGMYLLDSFNIIELPTAWSNLRILPENRQELYKTPTSFDYKKILPSLYRITVNSELSTVNSQLLYFNEAYDAQWKLLGAESHHMKCDGYANCYEVQVNGEKTVYLLYMPEILNLLGWGIMLIAFAILFRRFTKPSFEG